MGTAYDAAAELRTRVAPSGTASAASAIQPPNVTQLRGLTRACCAGLPSTASRLQRPPAGKSETSLAYGANAGSVAAAMPSSEIGGCLWHPASVMPTASANQGSRRLLVPMLSAQRCALMQALYPKVAVVKGAADRPA